jgi:hypothetical protein
MSKPTAHEVLTQALSLARTNGMYVVPCQDKGEPVHVLYRAIPGRSHGTRLGRCRSPAALLRKVKRCAVVTK